MKDEKPTVKTQIKKAFLELLSEKVYIDITVSDLVNKARVARMSFYRNFNGMDDVIESIADDIAQNFISILSPLVNDNSERKWRECLFALFYNFIQMKKEIGMAFNEFEKNQANYSSIASRVREKTSEIAVGLSAQTLSDKYIFIGKTGFIGSIAAQWAMTGMQETPEEIIDFIMPIIMKF